MRSFEDFYKHFGFFEYPFNTYTTEQERSIASELFVPMTEYGPIIESFKRSSSLIILGERGVGKTAVVEEFYRNMDKNSIFAVINVFDRMSIKPTRLELYTVIINKLIVAITTYLEIHPLKSMRLKKEERIYLSYLIYYYADTITSQSIKESVEKIQKPIIYRILSNIYNKLLRKSLNYAGTVLENGLKRWIAQTLNMVPFYNETTIHEYFPEIKLEVDTTFTDGTMTFYVIEKIADIAAHLSEKKCSVIIDRIDEDERLQNDAERTSEFIYSLLTDNNLFSCDKLQIVCSIWKTPFRYIEENVRSQKFFCPSLKWNSDDLKRVLNKRLSVFSKGKVTDYKYLFSEKALVKFEEAITLTNGVPRDLWHLFGKMFEEQVNKDPNSDKIQENAVESATTRFVIEFNYYEYYPRRANSRADSMDIYSYYAHLAKLSSIEFSKNMLNEAARTGSSTQNYVTGMEKIGLIERIRQDRGEIVYRIKDNKIIFAIMNKLDIRKK